jgi:RNA 2',3'-cyclic 3'-phosphodiesterase
VSREVIDCRALRLFVGLPLPASYQEALGRLQEKWRPLLRSRISWTRVGNWHMTLQFLGQVELQAVGPIQEGLSGIRFPPFVFQAGGSGFFPSGRRPRVLWVGLRNGGAQCIELAGAIVSVLEPLGFVPDRKTFSPHLTVARIREDLRDPWDALRRDLDGLQLPELVMERFVLWSSELSPHGPTYRSTGEYPLLPA